MVHSTPATPVKTLKGCLPTASISEDVDHAAIVTAGLQSLNSLNGEKLTEDASWKDLLALTGYLRTFHGRATVLKAWNMMADVHRPSDFQMIPNTSHVLRFGPKASWVHGMFSFSTERKPAARCSGIIGLVPDDHGNWKIWVFSTILEHVEGWPSVDTMEPSPAKDKRNGTNGSGATSESTTFDCVVVGAGWGGLRYDLYPFVFLSAEHSAALVPIMLTSDPSIVLVAG